MEVMIKRGYKSGGCVPINVSEIFGCIWDNCSGGYHERHAGYAIYGYISYQRATELGLCSGRHAGYGNPVKIMIPANRNMTEPHKSGYRYLCCIAGKKPDYRLPGQKPCTKRILALIDAGSMTRRCLRVQLRTEHYPVKLIARAITRLGKQGRVMLRGSSYDPSQVIEAVAQTHVIGMGRDPP